MTVTDTRTPPGAVVRDRAPAALTAGAVALVSLVAFEALAVSTVMPAVAAALDGLAVYALGFGAPLAASVAGMAVAGAWADARGPRRPLLASVLLFCAGLVVAGTATSMAVFVAGRAVQGLGGGMLTVALYAMLGTLVPEPARPRMLAAFAAAWVLPAMVGPTIAGALAAAAGWRSVFLVVPALAVPALALTLYAVRDADRVVPDEPADGAAGREAGGGRTALARVGLAVVAGTAAAALQVAGARDGVLARLAALAALGIVLAAAARLLPAGTFRLRRGLPSVLALRGLLTAGFTAGETFVPLLLVREHGWSPARAGVALTVGAFAWSATSWLQGRVPEVARRYSYARTGAVLLLAGVAVALVAALPGASGLFAVAGWLLTGAGMGLAYASTSLLSLHLSPADRTGETSSALTTSEALTSAVVLAAAGALFAALLPARLGADDPAGPAPYLAGFAVAVVASAAAVLASRRLRSA